MTKYALTQGIFPIEAEITEEGYARQSPTNRIGHFSGKNQYAATKEEAVAQAEEMRIKKLKSNDQGD